MNSRDMVTHFYLLQNEFDQFMNMRENPVPELDKKWLCDISFIVDISKHLSELSKKLQRSNQLLNAMYSKVITFETKLQLGKNNFKIMTPRIFLLYKNETFQQLNMQVNVQRFVKYSKNKT